MTRNRRTPRILGQSLLALTMGSAVAVAQAPGVPLPISHQRWLQLHNDPVAMSNLEPYPAPVVSPVAAGTVVGPWQSVTPLPTTGVTPANPLLMTDGTVIVHLIANGTVTTPPEGTRNWLRLTPDINGNYATGTWSTFATLPVIGGDPYAPIFFASEVLPDGRVIINGGEYNDNDNDGMGAFTTKGAIYYPSLGAWTPVAPPAPGGMAWTTIGDAQSVVLNNGIYMLANCCEFAPGVQALLTGGPPFNASAWTANIGFGKFDDNDEEGWTVLPNGNVLTVDANVAFIPCTPPGSTAAEIYNASTETWSSAGSTMVQLSDCNTTNGFQSFELGPQVLRPDSAINGSGDNVLAFGGTTKGTAHTAIFNASTSTWAAGPDVPSVGTTPYTLADAPAATLPSGNVLFAASPMWTGPEGTSGAFPNPTNFWEVGPNSGGNAITPLTQNPDGPFLNSFEWNFLVLPTGQVLAVETYAPNVWIYNPLPGSPNASWVPVIHTSPTDVTRANTYTLTGTQFNGLSHGAAYGDDVQANTNYPIVKIVNMTSGHIFYQRTFGFNTMSVARGTASSTNFTVSGTTEIGPSTLYVIANGISAAGVLVVVH
jgi:hypothetical protein